MKAMMATLGAVAMVAAAMATQPAAVHAQGVGRAAQLAPGAAKQLTCGTKDVDPVTMGLIEDYSRRINARSAGRKR